MDLAVVPGLGVETKIAGPSDAAVVEVEIEVVLRRIHLRRIGQAVENKFEYRLRVGHIEIGRRVCVLDILLIRKEPRHPVRAFGNGQLRNGRCRQGSGGRSEGAAEEPADGTAHARYFPCSF